MNERKQMALVVVVMALATPGCSWNFSASTAKSPEPPAAAGEAQPPAPAPTEASADATATPAATEAAPVPDATPAPEPEAPPAVTLTGARLNLPGAIGFQPGTPVLATDPGTQATLAALRDYLARSPRVTRLRIEGHLDNSTQEEVARQLSGFRASAVKQWLIANGAPGDRLLAVGFGFDRPIASNATAEGKAQNDRVEVHVAELDGTPYLSDDVLAGGAEFP